uniref:Chitin-binding type-1 domain-containing protein n=1 Tax=Spongospora subterranea TaxID=70186 RepID=A0A0H5RCU8_9EUKA|eukprot:CRZ06334.1 hypothetical protein [Spongospora subterranea]
MTQTNTFAPLRPCGSRNGLSCGVSECCSKWGYCGLGPEFCDRCQSGFGLCISTSAVPSTAESSASPKCGPNFGSCAKGCCSKFGYCGTTDEYCSAGCQFEFGQCAGTTPTTAAPKCGPNFGSCTTGCCSKFGYCGTSDEFCSAGCQSKYGQCTGGITPPTAAPTTMLNPKCGGTDGSCPFSLCCSKYGYCGADPSFCGAGCQSQFGSCTNIVPETSGRTTASSPASTAAKKCGPTDGKCATGCCSQFGYCGTTDEFCAAGCQSQFGQCRISPPITTAPGAPEQCGPTVGKRCSNSNCCSRYGYCGTSDDHCNAGTCQADYGICAGTGGGLTPSGQTLPNMFSPYLRVNSGRVPDYSAVVRQFDLKWISFAFVVSDSQGRPRWGGSDFADNANSNDLARRQLQGMRSAGADAIVSFGGATGPELAEILSSEASLLAAYQRVISAYNFKFADFDIEGDPLYNKASVMRRNRVIASLQKANPSLKVSFTLPVNPSNGLEISAVFLLTNAQSVGVRIDAVNIMAMDYGGYNGDMGQAAINAAVATRRQLKAAGISACVGVIPMLGVNDVKSQIFTANNARTLLAYAQNPANGICLLSFWSVDRDYSYLSGVSQTDYAFTSIFSKFD